VLGEPAIVIYDGPKPLFPAILAAQTIKDYKNQGSEPMTKPEFVAFTLSATVNTPAK